ncbi:hypothetical protein [Sphingomonas sp. ERG5]|uniref:hypothetical protein n=1 Tax=Sphingomonas sp. ERG5 TaxID=1381597 RepID=UPI00136492DC|nr:hypothetical protein [Sphingomonas sp. ERG5]
MRAAIGYLVLTVVLGALFISAFFVIRAQTPSGNRPFHYRFGDDDDDDDDDDRES